MALKFASHFGVTKQRFSLQRRSLFPAGHAHRPPTRGLQAQDADLFSSHGMSSFDATFLAQRGCDCRVVLGHPPFLAFLAWPLRLRMQNRAALGAHHGRHGGELERQRCYEGIPIDGVVDRNAQQV